MTPGHGTESAGHGGGHESEASKAFTSEYSMENIVEKITGFVPTNPFGGGEHAGHSKGHGKSHGKAHGKGH